MEELMAALKATERTMKSFESELSETKSKVLGDDKSSRKSLNHRSAGEMIDFNSAKKAVQKAAPQISFSKGSTRFPSPKKELNQSQASIDTQSTVDTQVSTEFTRKKVPQVFFPKAPRFEQSKTAAQTEFNLDPNFEAVKKKYPAAVIKQPTKKDPQVMLRKKLVEHPELMAKLEAIPAANEGSSGPAPQNNPAAVSTDITDLLDESVELLGPGAYEPQFSAVEAKRAVTIPRSPRWKRENQDEKTPLNPNFNLVRKTTPTARIVRESSANEKLLRKKAELEEYEKIAAEAYKRAPLEKHKAIFAHTPAAVIKDQFDALSEKEKLARIFMMIKRRREAARIAPGMYDPKDPNLDKVACMVKYSRSYSPKVKRLPERLPGPGKYYANDDMLHNRQPVYSFGKEGIEKKAKYEDFDWRKPLDVNFDFIKPRVPGGVINPESQNQRLPDLDEIKMGPGKYSPKHDLVEKRPDIGIIKMAELNEHNARENLTNLAKRDAVDVNLDPNYDPVKPRAPAWGIHDPVKLDGPANVPDAVLHPEQWKYYDVNKDPVKPNPYEADFARNMDRDQFLSKEELFNEFLRQRAKKKKQPEVGQYVVGYKQIDPERKAPDFDRYPERDMEEIKKDDRDVDGDVLILNPDRPKPHMPDIAFSKMQGRDVIEKDQEYKEELILEPKFTQVDPKVVTLVNMNKQTERKDPHDAKQDIHKEDLILNVNYDAVDPKIKGHLDFKKQVAREDHLPKPSDGERDVLIVDPDHDPIKPSIPGVGSMRSKAERFKDLPKEDPNDGKITTAQIIDYEKAHDSIKPEKNIVDFNRYDSRDVHKEEARKRMTELLLNAEQKKKEEMKKLAVIEEEKEGFQKYSKGNEDQGNRPGTSGGASTIKKDNNKKGNDNDKTKKNADDREVRQSKISPWENTDSQNIDDL